MTQLQELFKEAIEKTDCDADGIIYYDKAALACEKIAEEFAEEYATWRIRHLWKNKFVTETTSSKQLLQQFKEANEKEKEKG